MSNTHEHEATDDIRLRQKVEYVLTPALRSSSTKLHDHELIDNLLRRALDERSRRPFKPVPSPDAAAIIHWHKTVSVPKHVTLTLVYLAGGVEELCRHIEQSVVLRGLEDSGWMLLKSQSNDGILSLWTERKPLED